MAYNLYSQVYIRTLFSIIKPVEGQIRAFLIMLMLCLVGWVSGVAIGSGWQAIVAYVNLAAYYLVGLPIGCVLGFKTSLRVAVCYIQPFLN